MKSTLAQLRGSLPWPLTREGDAVLESFCAIPGLSLNVGQYPLAEQMFAFTVGHPLWVLAENASIAAHKRKIEKTIQRKEAIPLYLISELQAAALLTHWGLTPMFLKPTNTTPDLEATYEDGQVTIDVEITRADQRQHHLDAEKALGDLSSALQAGDFPWNIVCHMADASDHDDLYAVLDAATNLNPSESAEVYGRWNVVAVPLEQRGEVINGGKMFRPNWWPQNEPATFIGGTRIAGVGTVSTLFCSLIPHTSYRNPVLKKVNSGQHREGHPYLIAVDTTALPRAHERAREELILDFPVWQHVSGVLFFESRFYIGLGRQEWVVSLHKNPHALLPLPDCIALRGTHQPQSIVFHLSPRSIEHANK